MCIHIQIHTQGIEGRWSHLKRHTNTLGGTRQNMIQEKLDEYVFHRTYLRDQPMNCWVMLRLLAKYGEEAKRFVEANTSSGIIEDMPDANYYRANRCLSQSEINFEENHDAEAIQASNFPDWQLDDDNNLLIFDEFGDIQEVHYANESQRQMGVYERIDFGVDRQEMANARAQLQRTNITEIRGDLVDSM